MTACEATASRCSCKLTGAHCVHECSCGGSWTGFGDDFNPITYPDVSDWELVGALLALNGVTRGGIRFPTEEK